MNEPLTHTIACCAELNHLRNQLTTAMEAMRLLGEKHDAMCAQRDEARARVKLLEATGRFLPEEPCQVCREFINHNMDLRARVAGLEAQVAVARRAPHASNCSSVGNCLTCLNYADDCEIEISKCPIAKTPPCDCFLAALSADPLKVGEAAKEVERAVDALDLGKWADKDHNKWAAIMAVVSAAQSLSAAMKGEG